MVHRTLGRDEFLVFSNSLLKYVDGKLLSIHKIEDTQREREDITYVFSNNLGSHYHDGSINVNASSPSYPDVIIIDRPYFGKLIMNDLGVYQMDVFEDRPIHKAYAKTKNYAYMQYGRSVYRLIFLKEVFDLETGNPIDTLFFYPEIIEPTNGTNPRRISQNFGLEINKSFIWSIAKDNKNNILFYKMSRKNKLYKTSNMKLPKQVSHNHLRFDPLNPDYVIYNDNHKLVKKNILI